MSNQVLLHVRNLIIIVLGSLLVSFGLLVFLLPVGLAEGGMTGLGLLIYYKTHWSLSIITLILNIAPVLILYKFIERRTFLYSLFGSIFLSVSLKIMEPILQWLPNLNLQDDPLLAALYAGVVIGAGYGIIFLTGGGTGGADTIAQSLNQIRGFSIGHTIFCWDAIVLILSMYIIAPQKAMYTLIEILVVSRVINFITEGGFRPCRTVTIISSTVSELKKELNEKIGRGITLWQGKGAYTGENKEILYIVLASQELHQLKKIVQQIDPAAFIVIHNAKDVLGEGFRIKK